MSKRKTINVTMDDGLRNHLEAMAHIQSAIEGRTVSMAEICRKMLQKQSGYGIKRFCSETLTPIETMAVSELERLESMPHYTKLRIVEPETQEKEEMKIEAIYGNYDLNAKPTNGWAKWPVSGYAFTCYDKVEIGDYVVDDINQPMTVVRIGSDYAGECRLAKADKYFKNANDPKLKALDLQNNQCDN